MTKFESFHKTLILKIKYKYITPKKPFSSLISSSFIKKLCKKDGIVSIEDPMAEDDWKGWSLLTNEINKRCSNCW